MPNPKGGCGASLATGAKKLSADTGLPSALPQSPGLLTGVDAAVCQLLDIRRLGHRSALLELGNRDRIPEGSVDAAFRVITANWQRFSSVASSTSRANWRWRSPQLGIAARNTSPEVVLERAIVGACERQGRCDWSNQVPVASGIAGSSRDRRRAIDLVQRRGERHFELIELKIASDTPLYAAFEIIGYACIWLLSRQQAAQSASNPLLAADHLDTRVLAPGGFYAPYRLQSLQHQLDSELRDLGATMGATMGFRFDALPASFAPQPAYDDEAVLALIDARVPL